LNPRRGANVIVFTEICKAFANAGFAALREVFSKERYPGATALIHMPERAGCFRWNLFWQRNIGSNSTQRLQACRQRSTNANVHHVKFSKGLALVKISIPPLNQG
jgi:hypothetical protein